MVQSAKTEEILHYVSAFREWAARRGADEAAWLVQLREKAIAHFEQLGFPTTRDEAWKYTNVAPLVKVPFAPARFGPARIDPAGVEPLTYPESRRSQLVFVNGWFSAELSDISALPAGVTVTDFAGADQKLLGEHFAGYADYHNEAFTALNTAFAGGGAMVRIPEGKAVEAPIHLLFVTAADEPVVAYPRVLVVAGRGSVATIIESYAAGNGVYFNNAVTEVVVAEEAVIEHYRLQEESTSAFHIGTTSVQQERGSHYSSYAISVGAALARHTLTVRLNGERTESTVDGLYVVTGRQHVDNHTTIDHAQPHCQSHQLYKGILDEQARAVFDGKIQVRRGALLTDSRQLNKNLLLSTGAHVDTKPQLEIFADDVKCAHGATVGQLEEDEIFYLKSRGLTPEKARALLTYGFAEDVISKINVESVRRQLDEIVLTQLHQNLEVK